MRPRLNDPKWCISQVRPDLVKAHFGEKAVENPCCASEISGHPHPVQSSFLVWVQTR